MKSDFLAYYKKKCRGQGQKWDIVCKHFCNFVQGHCTCGEVNVELCKKFREYLLNANQLRLFLDKHTESTDYIQQSVNAQYIKSVRIENPP